MICCSGAITLSPHQSARSMKDDAMPIMLDDIDLSTAALAKTTVDPKFFSSKLTGTGKKTGLLNENLLPINSVTNTAYALARDIEVKQSATQHDITTSTVPLAPITRRALLSGGSFTIPVAHVDDRFAIDTSANRPDDWNVSFDMIPQGLTLYENKSGERPTRDLVIQYRMDL